MVPTKSLLLPGERCWVPSGITLPHPATGKLTVLQPTINLSPALWSCTRKMPLAARFLHVWSPRITVNSSDNFTTLGLDDITLVSKKRGGGGQNRVKRAVCALKAQTATGQTQ